MPLWKNERSKTVVMSVKLGFGDDRETMAFLHKEE